MRDVSVLKKGVLLSGMQPTGVLHLGNYIGALKNWVKLQDEHESCIFSVVDMHAITSGFIPQDVLHRNSLTLAAGYLACGIKPENCTIFIQSAVLQHAELCWILLCNTPTGWLNRMTQFKEKSAKIKSSINAGLLCYPVLMAADMLLYGATYIPVGDDQSQHLELTKDIAHTFNEKYQNKIFTIPEIIKPEFGSRIMSLRDGTKKMSKSDKSDYSRIEITDSDDNILMKIKKAKTDSIEGFSHLEKRPEVQNLVSIYSAITGESQENIFETFGDSGLNLFKQNLAEVIIEEIRPVREKYYGLLENLDYVRSICAAGAEQASERARATMSEVKACVGF